MSSKDKTKTKRLFVNNVNGFESKHIAKYLSQCIVGATLEEGEEEAEELLEEGDVPRKKEGTYEVYASTTEKDGKKPDFVKELFNFSNREEFYEHILECDIIVYDINDDPSQIDEAVWLVSALHADLDKLLQRKVFILVSSTMTWAKTKPLDAEDPEIPFTEEDYRRRKPHPSFKEHVTAEKAVLKCGKTNKARLTTYVVAAGLTFGEEENVFHYLFKAAWHNQPILPVYGPGDNVLPTIHVRDLASVIQNVADTLPKTYYLVAVCDSKNTLEEITRAVSQKLATGKIKSITKEDAMLQKDVTQRDLDMLTTGLRMDGISVRDNMRIKWASETGLPETINTVVSEYRQARSLLPLRICILGPPASGKTTLAHQIAEKYKLHHIKIKDVIDGAISELEKLAARANETPPEGEDAEEVSEEEEQRMAEAGEVLEQVVENQKENNNRLDEQYVLRFYKEKLTSKACQNQGFVLDGFPKTLDQATNLFQADDGEEEEEVEKKLPYNGKIMPQFLFILQASDDFLRQRVISLPEATVQGTHNTEEHFHRRLTEYRALNTEEDTVLNYFEDQELHAIAIDVAKEGVEQMFKLVGQPRNYGPTPEEIEEMRMLEEERRSKQEEEQRLQREKQEATEQAQRKRNHEEWRKKLDTAQREEQDMLDSASVPLRNYLMKHVMPTLTNGLMECVRKRPEDPIDHLAEFLFRNNPQV